MDISLKLIESLPRHLRDAFKTKLPNAYRSWFSNKQFFDIDSFSEPARDELIQVFFRDANNELWGLRDQDLMKSPVLQVMRELLLSVKFDPLYVRYFNERSRELINQLIKDPLVVSAIENWPRMSLQTRLGVIAQVNRTQDIVYGRGLGKFEASEVTVGYSLGGKVLGQSYNDDDGLKISINPDPAYGWNDFSVVLNTAIHEKLHIQQALIAYAWQRRACPEKHPFCKQGQLFHDYFYQPRRGNIIRFTDPVPLEIDFTRPSERHAHVTSTDIAYAVISRDMGTVDKDFPLDRGDQELARSWQKFNRYPLGWNKLSLQ